MIADVINCAIAGIDFIQAVGRVVIRNGFATGMNIVMMQNGITRRRDTMSGAGYRCSDRSFLKMPLRTFRELRNGAAPGIAHSSAMGVAYSRSASRSWVACNSLRRRHSRSTNHSCAAALRCSVGPKC